MIFQRELNRKSTIHLRLKHTNIERNGLFYSRMTAKHPWEVAQPMCVRGTSCLPQPFRIRYFCGRSTTVNRTWWLDKSRMVIRVPPHSSSATAHRARSSRVRVDDHLLRTLRETAKGSGSQLVLSSGALAGVDALSAAARIGMREVRHRIVKSPAGWGSAAGQVLR